MLDPRLTDPERRLLLALAEAEYRDERDKLSRAESERLFLDRKVRMESLADPARDFARDRSRLSYLEAAAAWHGDRAILLEGIIAKLGEKVPGKE